jgi:hypothetical protein
MKKVTLTLFCLIIYLSGQAQIIDPGHISKTINVTTAGTLSTLISDNEKNLITKLTLTGNIDARDISFLYYLYNLSTLDISSVDIQEYNGITISHPFIYSETLYPANEMPPYSFVYGDFNSTLKSVILPNSLTSIGKNAFYDCRGLTDITMPISIVSIGESAFYTCLLLKNINLPSSITSIGENAFYGCTKITSFVIPNNVTKIANGTFGYCSHLESITFPANLTSIESDVFVNCFSLITIYSYPTNPININTSTTAFTGIEKTNCTLYVPKGSKIAYQSENQWKDFINIIETPIPSTIEFAPIGAKWYYTQTGIGDLKTYKTIESVGDTIIEGKSCRKLLEVSRNLFAPIRDIRIMYSKNDSVSEYYNSSFHLLYDFGAMKGDTITLDVNLPKMIIDSTSTIGINGSVHKVQYVTCSDGMMVEFGGKVIEGIGNLIFMFPTYDNNYDGPLRCYVDPITGTYINPVWGSIDCENTIAGILKNLDREVSVYINKQSKNIVIKGIQNTVSYELFDIQGRKIKSGELNVNCSIEAEVLKPGIYLLKLKNTEMKIVRKLIMN